MKPYVERSVHTLTKTATYGLLHRNYWFKLEHEHTPEDTVPSQRGWDFALKFPRKDPDNCRDYQEHTGVLKLVGHTITLKYMRYAPEINMEHMVLGGA